MNVGVVGATGLVGGEMLRVLEERAFPVDRAPRVRVTEIGGPQALLRRASTSTCEVLRDGCFDGLDLVFIDVEDDLAREWAPRAAAAGATVIDKSAAFRMDPDVPLVVAEVNPDDLARCPKGIVSCPNCTTMVLVTALAPLHRAAGIERLVVSTYQSVSGAGTAGLRELAEQWTKGAGREDVLRRAGATPGAIEAGDVWDRPDRRQRHPAGRLAPGGGLHVGGVEARARDAGRSSTHPSCA